MEKVMAPKERKCYYDETGLEIQEGDLLKIFHFVHYRRREKRYMYHIAILQESKDGHWWAGKDYNRSENEGHYLLLAAANKQTAIIKGCRVVYSQNWEQEDRLRKEAKARIKTLTTQHT